MAWKTEEERNALIAERLQSGMTIKAFCEAKGISRNTFTGWLKRYDHRARPADGGEFIPLVVTNERSHGQGNCRVRIGQSIVMEIDDETSEASVLKALRCMEALCGPILTA